MRPTVPTPPVGALRPSAATLATLAASVPAPTVPPPASESHVTTRPAMRPPPLPALLGPALCACACAPAVATVRAAVGGAPLVEVACAGVVALCAVAAGLVCLGAWRAPSVDGEG